MTNGHRIPKEVRFGRGYAISVVLVPPTQLADLLDEEQEAPEHRSPGGWKKEDMAIYVSSATTVRERWEVYFHELIHAALDIYDIYVCDMRRQGK
jgi:hypothetical protein